MKKIPDDLLSLVESAPIAMSLTDARIVRGSHPVVAASRRFYDVTGFSPGRMLGNDPRLLQGPDTQAAALRAMREAIAAGQASETMVVNYRASGERWDNYLIILPVRSEDGTVGQFVGAHFDVPERDAARSLAAHMDALQRHLAQFNAARALRGRAPIGLPPIWDGITPGEDLAARRLLLSRLGALSVALHDRSRTRTLRRADEPEALDFAP